MNTQLVVGVRYVVTVGSSDGTFEVGDHISSNKDGSINCIEAQGWINSEDVSAATDGMEVSLDHEWVERKRSKLLEQLANLDKITLSS